MANQATIRVATRGSKLALAQTRRVIARLRRYWPDLTFEEVVIKTTGDRVTDVALSEIGGRGLFTKELERALLDGRAELAVHSAKDLPTELAQEGADLLIACYPERADPRDALVLSQRLGLPAGRQAPPAIEPLQALPPGARVGTSSLRRRAQLRSARPDLRFVDLRGNLDTRLRKLEQERLDAIVVACAGLGRLGATDADARPLSLEACLPAAGQGALAVEAEQSSKQVMELLHPLDDPEVRAAVTAERACLRELRGGCQVPIGVHAWLEGDQLVTQGVVASLDGEQIVRAQAQADRRQPQAIGRRLAGELLSAGADPILRAIRGSSGHDPPSAQSARRRAD